jgi:3-oxoacyl-[acyl-carrier protein] reductase
VQVKKSTKRKKPAEPSPRTVLITGGTSDIGRAIAERFASRGWNIICQYNSSADTAKELKKVVMSLGADCKLVKADFSSEKQVLAFKKKIEGLAIDSVINNAGSYVASRDFARLTFKDLIATFRVNTFAPLVITASIFEQMKKRGFGRIVNISSIAAKYGGSSNSMHYGCSKRALEGMTKTLAREGAKFNVLVNTVRPGVIDTAFHNKFPKNMKKRVEMIPLKSMGTPGDIADMVYHLGSDKNRFITNETITVSGGE